MKLQSSVCFVLGKIHKDVIFCVVEISTTDIWLHINILALSEQEAIVVSTLASTRKDFFTFEDARAFWNDYARTANALAGWPARIQSTRNRMNASVSIDFRRNFLFH